MSNWDKMKQALGITPKIVEDSKEVKKTSEELRREVLAKEKEEATAKGEPWVGVLDTQVNPDNIRNGFFELDWNNEFVEKLLDAGYTGETNEEIVDGWFKTVIAQMLQEEGEDPERGAGFIETTTIEKNKTKVS